VREREFRLLFVGQSVSVLGDATSGVALAVAGSRSVGRRPSWGWCWRPERSLFVFLLVGGVIADRLPRRW
jgi:hypothetical protein